jgi:hypothetical protein
VDDRGPLHGWRDGMARFADGLPLPGRSRVRRIDPALAISSVCRHEWLPSPIGPAEYCGRCGAMRRRQPDGQARDGASARPIIIPGVAASATATDASPKLVGTRAWPDASAVEPAAGTGSAAAASAWVDPSAADDLALGAAPDEMPLAAARPVGPRMTRPAPLAAPVVLAATSSEAPAERQRSFIRTATIGAVLLSFGVLIGFIGADLSRDAREGRGVVALAPTSTPTRSSPDASSEPSTVPMATPAPSLSAVPGATPAPLTGPVMAPPVVGLGGRLAGTGMALDLAWQPPSAGERVSRYDLRASTGGEAYRTISLAKRTSRTASIAADANRDLVIQLRASGSDGTPGAWVETAIRLSRVEESAATVRASKGWKVAKHPAYTGSGARYATADGAELSLAFDGPGVAIVGPKGPGRGRADIFVDGERIGRFDALGDTFRPVRLLFTADGLASGPHVLTVRVAGTAGRPMVAVDRFLVLSQP